MLTYLVPLYLILWLAGVAMHFAYKRRLRALDPQLAKRRYPGLLRKNAATDISAVGFLFRGKFRELKNPSFIQFSEFYRAFSVIWIGVFLATIVAVFVAG
jgi:hypothetical protein